ncbi:MAG TPA: Nramp family divalent metal transporter [Stenomitos sp.]
MPTPDQSPQAEPLISIRFNKRRWLLLGATLGPGIIAAIAGDDAGGIATYATAGANYGYDLLWALVLITFILALVQEMCARMGAVTGRGLSALIRERFGVRWTAFAMIVLLVANIATAIGEFAGVAAAGEVLGVSKYVAVPIAALGVWLLIVKGNFGVVEKVFFVLALTLVSYVVSGFMVGPPWALIAHRTVVPTLHMNSTFLLVLIATIGTTITPYMQFFLQSNIVDKGITIKNYGYAKLDVFVGSFVTDLIAFFIIVATAATLNARGIHIETAAEAALALAPVAGKYATYLFAAGLLGASLLAACVLPLTTAYAVCEAFGWETGISKGWDEAPSFMGIYTALIVLGAGIVLLPNLPLFLVLLVSQDINGILLPVILIFILLLVNDRRIMGRYVNGRFYNAIAWTTAVLLIVLTIILLYSSLPFSVLK